MWRHPPQKLLLFLPINKHKVFIYLFILLYTILFLENCVASWWFVIKKKFDYYITSLKIHKLMKFTQHGVFEHSFNVGYFYMVIFAHGNYKWKILQLSSYLWNL
jgi:hypothetical protein